MGIVYNTQSVRQGIIIHWDPANRKSYPGSGVSIADLSGNNRNGLLINGMSVTNNVFSNSDNRTKAIYIASQDWSSFTNYTVDIWYKRTGINNHGTGGPGSPSYYQGIFNYYWDGDNSIFVGTQFNATSTNLTILGISTTLALNTWVNIVGIGGPGGRSAYVNGQLIGTAAGSTVTANKDIYFGNWDTSWASFCDMGPIKAYNRALSSAEIRQNFEAHRDRYGI